ncbi:MAG: hypothetical protein KGJ59_06110 [Bacteroidota bacterium]|nr:hypothetical protein [Bacteroidota bacterium]
MRYRREFFFYMIAVLLFGGCASERSAVSQSLIHPVRNPIPPNHCRIRGTITAIDSAFADSDSSQPCAKIPCNAEIRIDSILGYGSSFGEPVVEGKEYAVHFAFTLARTTKELFPSMNEGYPGLNVGSSFVADIEQNAVRGATKSVMPVFVIYGYSVIR